ncbi:universal stress protein [Sulfitobacter dubius]|uniref:universal stress protein n=1 Tax=Sulfitobacter dubius TaxID=218673 RepID=UPI0008E7B274|nr:universal stress protein [Sulfitobacter dubius]SFG54972.1 Universal stress protein family protein [Sulfitobacter dubius]
MTIKTILSCLTDPRSAKSVLAAAALIARRHDAHVIGLHTVESLAVYPGVALHVPDIVFTEYGRSQVAQSEDIKEIFETSYQAEEFAHEWRLLHSQSETAAERIVESAHCADIVLMAAADPDADTPAHARLLESVIRDAGRPVLVVPQDFSGDHLGQSIVLGWNGTREAVRAAHDALALLQAGDCAHILRVNDHSHDAGLKATSGDLAAAFDRHGIETTLVERSWERPGVAAALSREAMERGADMVAVGAFGHSRAYDLVIGAATRDLLRHSEVPVLFSR